MIEFMDRGRRRPGGCDDSGAAAPGRWRRVGVLVGAYLAAVTIATAVTDLMFFGDLELPAFAPVSGVNAAFLLLAPRRRRPVCVAAVVVTAVVVRIAVLGLSPGLSVVVGVALGVEALVFAVAWRARAGSRLPSHEAVAPKLLAVAALAALTAGAVVAVGTLVGVSPGMPLPTAWLVRTCAGLTGIAVVVPLLLAGPALLRAGRHRLLELGAIAVVLVALFYVEFRTTGAYLVFSYVPLAFLLAAVVRRGRIAADVLVALWVPLTVWHAAQGHGAWGSGSAGPLTAVVGSQLYNLTAVVAARLVAVVVEERAAAQAELAATNQELETRVARRTADLAGVNDQLRREAVERAEAEEARRASEAGFRSALDTLLDGFVMLRAVRDGGGTIVDFELIFANETTLRYDHWQPEDASGRRMSEVLPGFWPAGLFDAYVRVVETGQPLIVDGGWFEDLTGPGEGRHALDLRGSRLGDGLAVSWRDVTSRQEAEAELARRALYDPLTGLANRQLLRDRVQVALGRLERHDRSLALCYLDLDHFKDVNDSLGHEVGDAVLIEVARRLSEHVRAIDTVSRLAGDEFVVVCPDLEGEADLERIAGRLLEVLARPVEVGGRRVDVGASAGVTITRSPSTDVDALLRQADAAMYEVKRRGRRGWQVYDDALHDHARRRHAVQEDLREALAEEWFELRYQPVLDLRDGRIVAAEALLRMVHPVRGLIEPCDFIDVAEDSELILPIGEWVLREACRQAAVWNEAFGEVDVAVNVSGRQATRTAIADVVLDALDEVGLAPPRLCIEVTERVLVDVGVSIVSDLHRLTDRGVHLAIDDFGTGYSSLTYLKHFPVDTVKIDRSFVAELGVARHDTAIVEAITTLARTLELTTVAEGIEHDGQRRRLRDLGCDHAQGFLFHRPLPASEVTDLLAAQAAGSGTPVAG
jgi:diguanylate cyclase (GGDEF)-like protein